MIELNQLKQLIAIVENKTISKAADSLYISQPAISRSMQKLENELGVEIFTHYKNKIVINDNGLLVYKHAKKIIKSYEMMIDSVRDYDLKHKSITISSCAPSPFWEIEPIIKSNYPNVLITKKTLDKKDLEKELIKGHSDITITPYKVDNKDILSIPFFEEDLYLSLPKDHKFSKRQSITFKELNGETMILYSDIGFWHDMHQKTMPKTNFLIQNERTTFKEIVKASSLPSFTTNISIKNEGKMKNRIIIPFDEKEAHVHFHLNILKKSKTKYNDLLNKIKKEAQ